MKNGLHRLTGAAMVDSTQFTTRLAERTARRVASSVGGDVQSQLDTLRTSMQNASGQIAGLQGQMGAAGTTITNLTNWLTMLDQEADATASGLTTLSSEVGSDRSRIAAVEAREANYLKRFMLPDWNVVIAQNLTIALSLGARTYTINLAASYGVKAGDPIFVSPKAAVLAGYLVGAASAPAANQLQVQILNPLIAIGGSASIPLSVFTLRP